MEALIQGTAAYKIFSGDRLQNKLSHAYMLHFQDEYNLRRALKLFAAEFFGAEADALKKRRIESGSYTDLRVYPEDGGKIAADGVSAIIEDCQLRPVEGEKKLYVICGFETASRLVQNKLLKTLEEPPEGIYFLLGVVSAAPVLDTVKSRVKLLEIPPFSVGEIYAALERRGHADINRAAAESANGILGAAENIVRGSWFGEVSAAAQELCAVTNARDVGATAAKYGDIKYKRELLAEMQRLYFTALTSGVGPAKILHKSALISALERLNRANADLKFNASFQALLYDFMLKTCADNERAEIKQ